MELNALSLRKTEDHARQRQRESTTATAHGNNETMNKYGDTVKDRMVDSHNYGENVMVSGQEHFRCPHFI